MRIVFLSLVAILFANCLPPKTYYLNKNYRFEQEKVKIALFPLQWSAITINNPDDIKKHFKGCSEEPEEIVMDSGYKYIAQGINDTIKKASFFWLQSVDPNISQNNMNFINVDKKIGKDSILFSFKVPNRNEFNQLFKDANAAIIIDRIELNKNSTNIGSGAMMGPMGGSGGRIMMGGGSSNIKYFEAKVTYLVWDYDKNEIISCGLTDNAAGYLFLPNQKTWKSLFINTGRRIASLTPFKKPQNSM